MENRTSAGVLPEDRKNLIISKNKKDRHFYVHHLAVDWQKTNTHDSRDKTVQLGAGRQNKVAKRAKFIERGRAKEEEEKGVRIVNETLASCWAALSKNKKEDCCVRVSGIDHEICMNTTAGALNSVPSLSLSLSIYLTRVHIRGDMTRYLNSPLPMHHTRERTRGPEYISCYILIP